MTRPKNKHFTIQETDFSGPIRSRRYRPPGNHWWEGDFNSYLNELVGSAQHRRLSNAERRPWRSGVAGSWSTRLGLISSASLYPLWLTSGCKNLPNQLRYSRLDAARFLFCKPANELSQPQNRVARAHRQEIGDCGYRFPTSIRASHCRRRREPEFRGTVPIRVQWYNQVSSTNNWEEPA
jgi:hypothetical protein